MLAVVCRELSGLDGLILEEWPAPEPGPGEVCIRVRTAGLNFADTLIIKGRYQERPPLPFVPGMEIAGTIDTCGAGVTDLAPGERVLATLPHGGFAEAAVTAADQVVRLPGGRRRHGSEPADRLRHGLWRASLVGPAARRRDPDGAWRRRRGRPRRG